MNSYNKEKILRILNGLFFLTISIYFISTLSYSLDINNQKYSFDNCIVNNDLEEICYNTFKLQGISNTEIPLVVKVENPRKNKSGFYYYSYIIRNN